MVGESVDKMKGAGEGETGSHGHKDGVAALGIGQHRRTKHFSTSGHKFKEVTLGKLHCTGLKQPFYYTPGYVTSSYRAKLVELFYSVPDPDPHVFWDSRIRIH
jgi:hypothetical protein